MICNTYYGNYRQIKLTDVWDNLNKFKTEYKGSPFYTAPTPTDDNNSLSDTNIALAYYLLYANYGNSIIASSDINRFKFKLFSIIFQYGASWVKEIEIQRKLRGLSEDDLLRGSLVLHNHAYNPETAPSTTGDTVLNYINEQNSQNVKKSKATAYAELAELLKRDVSKEFIDRFKPLFLTIVEPERPLYYISEDNIND